MRWHRSHRASQAARKIADRHYNRQKVGTPQFVPPGRCLVLWMPKALWVTSWPYAEYVKHDWGGAWVCSTFRNEGAGLSSELVLEAVAATLAEFGPAPALGMVTMVDPGKIKSSNPGCCFKKAGFVRVGTTKGGLHVLQLSRELMPAPEAPLGWQGMLFAAAGT